MNEEHPYVFFYERGTPVRAFFARHPAQSMDFRGITQNLWHHSSIRIPRAFAVKVVPKRLPVFPFSGLLKGCKGHKTHRFENGGTNQIRKTGKRC